MIERLSIEAGEARLDRWPLSLRVGFDPFSLTLERAGEPLLGGLTLWAAAGESHDRFLQPTEGVIPPSNSRRRSSSSGWTAASRAPASSSSTGSSPGADAASA